MDSVSPEGFESLLEGPSPAVLTTYRKDGTALVSPVWFRFTAQRAAKPGVLLRVRPDATRTWDLRAILPG